MPPVTEQLRLLAQIQEVDRQRNQQKNEAKRLPEKLKQMEQALQKQRDALDQLGVKKTRLDKERRDKELELSIQEGNLEKLKGRLTQLKTNEEYKAHLKEIEMAQAKRESLEENLLMQMEEVDLFKKEYALHESILTEAQRQFQAEKQAIDAEMERLTNWGHSLEAERSALVESADKTLLEQYKKLLILCKGLAVVFLEGNTCGGCHVSLPPQRIAEVKSEEKILTCIYCNRILCAAPKTA